jgi:hypothetical protein
MLPSPLLFTIQRLQQNRERNVRGHEVEDTSPCPSSFYSDCFSISYCRFEFRY